MSKRDPKEDRGRRPDHPSKTVEEPRPAGVRNETQQPKRGRRAGEDGDVSETVEGSRGERIRE